MLLPPGTRKWHCCVGWAGWGGHLYVPEEQESTASGVGLDSGSWAWATAGDDVSVECIAVHNTDLTLLPTGTGPWVLHGLAPGKYANRAAAAVLCGLTASGLALHCCWSTAWIWWPGWCPARLPLKARAGVGMAAGSTGRFESCCWSAMHIRHTQGWQESLSGLNGWVLGVKVTVNTWGDAFNSR